MMTLTRYGLREWGLGGIAALLVLAGCGWLIHNNFQMGGHPVGSIIGWSVGILTIIVFLGFAAFFRNPARKVSGDPRLVVSPADGVVRDIEIVDDFNFPPFNGKAQRIGIFLSVLNVHVNRIPADFIAESKYYREGEYLDARHSECSKRNEAMTIAGTATVDGKNYPMAVRQISGAIARRIVCPVEPGQKFRKGTVYGMIKFGSRTELYLPVDQFDINVKIGDRVFGGETVMATIKK